jgi:hypothetical protein
MACETAVGRYHQAPNRIGDRTIVDGYNSFYSCLADGKPVTQ